MILLEFLLKNIVAKPEKIIISCDETADAVHFKIEADDEDKKIIIGKAGQTIKALRTLLSVAERQQGKSIFLEVA